jgi:hypothetical protein
MHRTEDEVEVTTGALKRIHAVAGDSPRASGSMQSRKHCAYNQTRECFLGLEVTTADLSGVNFKERVASLAFKSGEGLWISPFSGIPETGMREPVDLIYLDANCRVIDAVESFPVCHVATSVEQAASVLALPIHSIYSSQTQPGDQLVICMADEMESRLQRFSTSNSVSIVALKALAVLREQPLWAGGPGLLQLEDRSHEEFPKSQQIHQISLVEPGLKSSKPPKSWLQRWWSPDPRKAPRDAAPGLAAYYWNGAAPNPHYIKDISSTGLYLVTEERWYPGTLVLMTLQHTESGERSAERTVSVHCRAVRWGADGVGLQFVLPNTQNLRPGMSPVIDGVDKKELDRFLQSLRKDRD